MNIPSHKQMAEILESKLSSDYPDESVENGENWELIAEIFFKTGFEAARSIETDITVVQQRGEHNGS